MRKIFFGLQLAVLLFGTLGTWAQNADLNTWLMQLQSDDPSVRETGFYSIAKARVAFTNDQVKLALINLLALEESYAKQESSSRVLDTEGYSNYFSDVVTTVAALRDARSIDVLIGVVSTGGAVGDALASFGDSAVEKIVNSSASPEITTKFFAILVIGKMLDARTITDPTSTAKIRDALNSASLDADYNTGLAAQQGLLKFFHVSASGNLKRVQINIKPGGSRNVLNPRENGVVPVAVLSGPDFDATTIDSATLRFGPGQAVPANGGQIEDVNGDGLPDIVVHFPVSPSQIKCGDTASFLVGKTTSGQMIVGSDSLVTVDCK